MHHDINVRIEIKCSGKLPFTLYVLKFISIEHMIIEYLLWGILIKFISSMSGLFYKLYISLLGVKYRENSMIM